MAGVTILDRTESGDRLAFDLLDVLQEISSELGKTMWRMEQVECFGEASGELHSLSIAREYVPGTVLLELASKIYQVIDGEFYGYKKESNNKAWIIIRAVDSSAFDVECEDREVLERYRTRFRHVADISEK